MKGCAEQLKDAFTNLLNTSLRHVIEPTSWQSAIIKSVPKKLYPVSMNELCPLAWTPSAMKFFEELVIKRIKEKKKHVKAGLTLNLNSELVILFIDLRSAF